MRLLFIIAAFALLLGCVGEWRTIAEPKVKNTTEAPAGEPDSIGYMYVGQDYGYGDETDSYNVSFTLEDESGKVTDASGYLYVNITDGKGKALYLGQASVSAESFEASEGYPYYGNKAYFYSIPFDRINKSQTSYANFSVRFVTGDGKEFTMGRETYLSYTLVNSSSYSGGYYDSYLHEINVSTDAGPFTIILKKGGSYGTYTKTYQLDIEVRNDESKKREVVINDAALVWGGQQYESSLYSYTRSLGDIYPQAAVKKSLTFYNFEEASGNATLYMELGIWEDDALIQKLDVRVPFKP